MWSFFKKFFKALNPFKGGGGNLGHRLYDRKHPEIPENSIAALHEGLKYQLFEDFFYWEFDVVESSDGIIFVFHDSTKRKTIKRLCPTAPSHLKKKSIYELPSSEISQLTLMHTTEKIPTIAELFSEFSRQNITKPIRVEIKKLLTREAKYDLVIMAKEFRDSTGYDVDFIMFRSKFKRVFKKDKEWFLALLKDNGFGIRYI